MIQPVLILIKKKYKAINQAIDAKCIRLKNVDLMFKNSGSRHR